MQLFQHRWHVRAIARLHELNGARFVELKHALDVNAESLSRCLEKLISQGLVERNPGYGHPLRPEYLLTKSGGALGPHCGRFVRSVDSLAAASVVYRKWSVPILVSMHEGCERFSDLRHELKISPRALTQALSRLCCAELARRSQVYRPTAAGARVARLALRIG